VITEDSVREILAQYERFGWQLERVLLNPKVKVSLGELAHELFDVDALVESDLDAAWFSRSNSNGRVAWELRSLGPTPFALVDSAEPNASDQDLNELFERVENQMRLRLIRPTEN
jgi:hypothetical protein